MRNLLLARVPCPCFSVSGLGRRDHAWRRSAYGPRFLAVSVVLIGLCLLFTAGQAPAAVPPPPRDQQQVQAVLAQAPAGPPADELRPLRIVLIANRKDHGPREHDYPVWLERWKVLLGGREAGVGQVNMFGPASDPSRGPPAGAAKVTVQTAKDWASAEQWAWADLVVAYFGTGGIWDEAKLRDLRGFLDRGGGFVAVHSATIAETPHARPLAELIGLAWEGGYTLFRYGHLPLEIVNCEHPICQGLPARIEFEDESYWPLVGDAARIELLATADEQPKGGGPPSPQPMFWTHAVGAGRVFGCIPGHYTWTFDDPYFRILLFRGMAWAAKESPYRFDPLVLCGARVADAQAAASVPADVAPAAPDAQDPRLLLWLDASDPATLTTDADGRVSAWSNKAARVGRKLTSSAAQQPLYVAQALGGRPTIRFDGVDDVLRDTGFAQSAGEWSVLLVVTPRSNTGDGQFRALLAANRPGQDDFLSGLNLDLGPRSTADFSVLNLEGIKDTPGATNLRTQAAPFGEGQLIVLTTGSAQTRLWINGVEEDGRAANGNMTAMGEIRIGGRFYAGRERGFFEGEVSEVLIYDKDLTDAERGGLVAHLLQKYGPAIRQPVAYTLEGAWEYLQQYDWSQPRRPLEPIDEALRSRTADPTGRARLESRLAGVLADPAATVAAKDYACRRLAIIGSAASLPALAGLLADEKLANMACLALARIPDPAAEEALHRELNHLRGVPRLGVIQALGSRRSQAAVADLVRLLADEDPVTRQTAAAALGDIGGAAAADGLLEFLTKAPAAQQAVFAENCLKCAEQFRAAGRQTEALALYERLNQSELPATVRIAATRGILVLRGADGVPLLMKQLAATDPRVQVMALQLVRDLPGKDVTQAVASRMSHLPSDCRARVIAALAEREDATALPDVLMTAILAAVQDDAPVRIAAVRALGRLGDAAVVPQLLAAGGEGEFAEAVADSLAMLPGEPVDTALVQALRDNAINTRRVAIMALGRRAYEPATPALFAVARGGEPALRRAAIQALGETATAAHAGQLTDLLLQAREADDAAAAETAVATVCARSDEPDALVQTLTDRWAGTEPAGKLALLGALRRLAGSQALATIRQALGDANADVQDAAIRILSDWPDAGPADDLLDLARHSTNERQQLLALRGYLRMANQEAVPAPRRLAMASEALRLARRDDERRLALSVLARVPSVQALAAVLLLDSETVKDEAATAAVAIAEQLPPGDAEAVVQAMDKVLDVIHDPELRRRATQVREKARTR